jgi:hypothetical protein
MILIVSSDLCLSYSFFHWGCSTKMLFALLFYQNACYIPHPLYASRFYHINNNWRRDKNSRIICSFNLSRYILQRPCLRPVVTFETLLSSNWNLNASVATLPCSYFTLHKINFVKMFISFNEYPEFEADRSSCTSEFSGSSSVLVLRRSKYGINIYVQAHYTLPWYATQTWGNYTFTPRRLTCLFL